MPQQTNQPLKNPKAKKRFFNDKRTQSVGIAIAKMPIISKVEEALKKMDITILSYNQITALVREFITDEELAEYEAQNESGMQWEKAEEFMVALSKIPFSKIKLTIWTFTCEYEENYENVISTVNVTNLAIKEIKNNQLITKILGYILSIGNILNAGTTKGQADGFNMDIITKLNTVKDVNNKTLGNFICNIILKDDTSIETLKKNCLNITEASKISYAETQITLNKLKKDLKEHTANFDKLKGCNDEFCAKTKKLIGEYTKDIEVADKTYSEMMTNVQNLVTFYGYSQTDSKYKVPEEFFGLFNDFVNDIDKSLPVTEPKKVFNRKYEVGKKIIENANTNNMDAILSQLKLRPNV